MEYCIEYGSTNAENKLPDELSVSSRIGPGWGGGLGVIVDVHNSFPPPPKNIAQPAGLLQQFVLCSRIPNLQSIVSQGNKVDRKQFREDLLD